MKVNNEVVDDILKKDYSREKFLFIARDSLLPDYMQDEHVVVFNNSVFDKVIQLGFSKQCELTVFEVILNPDTHNRRVAITQEMFRILKDHRINNALVSFSNFNGKNYRISLLTSKHEFKDNKIEKIISNPRRFSYSLGHGTKTITPYRFLVEQGKVNSLGDLQNRFSLEVVNKQFYDKIATCFTALVGGERTNSYKKIEKYKRQLVLPGVKPDAKYAEFAVRLIGRIVFCWFLKEKKSDDGVALMPHDILSPAMARMIPNYYHVMLEPIFFELLNKKSEKREGRFATDKYFKNIPYLNGGLFSDHNDDHYKLDKINECGQLGLVKVPNEWLVQLLEILEQYNFTVDENTSYDIELSIDPEMLGRIFENLLAEINPETGESARKSTGSFYTPREIVDYMVDSSLQEYLKEKTQINTDRLNNLISYTKESPGLTANECKVIVAALYNLTVLDPACGSGAFPIGMLQKIVFVLQEVDADCYILLDEVCKGVPALVRNEFHKMPIDYLRKLLVIQKSIFGVDIQPVAVEIARLRCFLSLVIEEKIDDKKENRGIKPLPNLDFKFVTANSLIDLPPASILVVPSDENIKKLEELREEYFSVVDDARKMTIKYEFTQIQHRMFENTFSVYTNVGKQEVLSDRYQALARWRPFENESTSWFDPEWMFGVNGFDIVIANPPYVESRSPNFCSILKQKLQSQVKIKHGKSNALLIPQGSDLLIYFLDRSISFSAKTGIITYITSSGWLNNEYGAKFQKFLLNNTNVLAVVDTDFKYFESANINTIITFFKGHTKTKNEVAFVRYHKKFGDAKSGIDYVDLKEADLNVTFKSIEECSKSKWGVFFNADTEFFSLLEILNTKGYCLDRIGFSIGQGLNLCNRDAHTISEANIKNLQIPKSKCIPFFSKEDSGLLTWDLSTLHIISNQGLSIAERDTLKKNNYMLFDLNSTRKQAPLLIMPRGIGDKHYCTMNNTNGFSDSGVDIYGPENKREDALRIWLFCNSSICWLLREKFGRKNLGGGLLKAEAVDLKNKPLYFKFPNIDEIKTIYNTCKSHKVKNCISEIEEAYHKKIDQTVFDYLELNDEMREYIVTSLKESFILRAQKSKQKG